MNVLRQCTVHVLTFASIQCGHYSMYIQRQNESHYISSVGLKKGRDDSVHLSLVARVNTAVINESYKVIVKRFDDVLGDAIG